MITIDSCRHGTDERVYENVPLNPSKEHAGLLDNVRFINLRSLFGFFLASQKWSGPGKLAHTPLPVRRRISVCVGYAVSTLPSFLWK